MSARARRLLGVTVAAVVLIVLGVVLLSPNPGRPSNAASPIDLVQQYDAADRAPISPFTVRLLDGSSLDSADLRGRVTVVNVWGSWCGPCRIEAPELVDVATELGARVRFLGINVRDSPDAARAFERAYDVPYPSVHPDDSPGAILAFDGALTAAAVPSTVVLDAEGSVAARVVGQLDATTLRGLIDDVLGPTPDAGSDGR